jgi:hypothetical protein
MCYLVEPALRVFVETHRVLISMANVECDYAIEKKIINRIFNRKTESMKTPLWTVILEGQKKCD